MNRALELAAKYPHEFTLQYPRREYARRFAADMHVDPAALDEAVLYVHVPFCARRCSYCNFAVDVDPDTARMERYVNALERRLAELPLRRVLGVDVGGGTPTRLPPRLLARVVAAVARFGAPISIETTPELAGDESITAMHDAHRVSVGLQSSDADRLGALGRDREIAGHRRALERLRAAFPRTSVDLIFALPGQTRSAWLADLDAAIALEPDTITTYDCLYRGRGRALTRRSATLPTPATYAELYDAGYERLLSRGYHAVYGSLNFSRHAGETGTSVYFEKRLLDGVPYVGIGNYASSHAGDVWTFEAARVEDWLAGARGDAYRLDRDDTIAKYLLLSLSFGFIDRARFRRRFVVELEVARPQVGETSLRREGDRWVVTRFGDMPRVRALMYSRSAIEWLDRHRGLALTTTRA